MAGRAAAWEGGLESCHCTSGHRGERPDPTAAAFLEQELDAPLTGEEPVQACGAPGSGRTLGLCHFRLPSSLGWKRKSRRAGQPGACAESDGSEQFGFGVYGGFHPPTHTLCSRCAFKKKKKKEGSVDTVTFLFLVRTVLLEPVGVDTRVSGNRGFLEAELWETAAWGSRSSSESSGGADRGALHSLSGAPGRRAGPAATRPEVVRAGGEGALWPADAASSPPRWAWCRPRPPRAPRPDLPNVDCIGANGQQHWSV